MEIKKAQFSRIKNIQIERMEKDFTFNAFSFLILGIIVTSGVLCQFMFSSHPDKNLILYVCVGILLGGGLLTVVPKWISVLQLIALGWIAMFAWLGGMYWILLVSVTLGLFIAPSCELIYQWDKVVVLRLGKFKKVHGPGLFFLLPLVDRIAAFVDTRIRVTDFSAEKTITRDTVPVHVDALAFWMIWNAKQAVLEVENFMEAVTLSAQTALRDSIGKHDLAELLSERDKLCAEIQTALDAKTNPWGISILSIEFTDIIIPQGLEDAMSKRAQAEREKQSRVILGTAEVEIAEKFAEASKQYIDNPTALHLRAMNMVYEGIRQRGSMVLLPSSALDSMNLGTTLGALALEKTNSPEKKEPEADTSPEKEPDI